MNRVLITDYVHPSLITGLEQLGFETEYLPDFDPNQLKSKITKLYGIVINSKIKMTSEAIGWAENLKFIARLGSGLEIIDLEFAQQSEINVYNSPEGNRNAVAEHALGMLLCLSNNLIRADKEVRDNIWNRELNRGFELEGKTIGIIGMGNTGQSFARKLSNWALEVIAYDPYVLEFPKELSNIRKVSLSELNSKADIISLHVQLTNETRHLVDMEFINQCKNGVILINTSRGNVLKTIDIVQALESKKMGGACLDVFENERPHTFTEDENRLYKRLCSLNNVVLSPHIAGWTHQSLYKIAQVLLAKIEAGMRSA